LASFLAWSLADASNHCPIRLRPPVIACFSDPESRNLKDLLLIAFRLARGRAKSSGNPRRSAHDRTPPRCQLADRLKGMTPQAMREAFDWGPDGTDTLARPISYAGAAVPADVLHDVRMKLAAPIGL
jgi:hypothetical protein